MRFFRKILVPYDNTKSSDHALSYALDIAQSSEDDCQIILLHVIPAIPTPLSSNKRITDSVTLKDSSNSLEKIYGELEAHTSKVLEDKKNSILQELKGSDEWKINPDRLFFATHVTVGDNPAQQITDYAKLHKVDLIVISSRSTPPKKGIKRWLWVPLGSVSRAIAEMAPCPVLLVRPV